MTHGGLAAARQRTLEAEDRFFQAGAQDMDAAYADYIVALRAELAMRHGKSGAD